MIVPNHSFVRDWVPKKKAPTNENIVIFTFPQTMAFKLELWLSAMQQRIVCWIERSQHSRDTTHIVDIFFLYMKYIFMLYIKYIFFLCICLCICIIHDIYLCFQKRTATFKRYNPQSIFENLDFAKSFGVTWHIFVFPEKVRLISLEGTIYPVFVAFVSLLFICCCCSVCLRWLLSLPLVGSFIRRNNLSW